MDFELSEELRMLKDSVRRFVDRELIPLEGKGKNPDEIRKTCQEKAKELGLWLFDVPEEYGGLGLGMMARVIVWEEISRTTAIPSRGGNIFGPDVSPLLYLLEGEAKEKYFLPVLRGEKRACFAQTEPDAGSDPGGMRTTAVRQGDHYVINGSKRFITNADKSDFAQVFALTDPAKRSKGGISAFLVDMNTPGLRLGRPQELMIDDTPWEIFFDDVKVPVANRVGEEGEGFKFAQSWINAGRIRHGARGIGVMERCLELATSYAKQRHTFGKPLSERQSVQWSLVDSYTELHQLKLMVYHAAWKFDRGEDCRDEAYMAKFFGDEKSFKAADRCLQIHGGMGLSKELPIEYFFREQRSMMITEGANEVLKMALARSILSK